MPQPRYRAVFVNPHTGEDVTVSFTDLTECRQFVQIGHWSNIDTRMVMWNTADTVCD